MRQLLAFGLGCFVLGIMCMLCGCGADNRGQAEFPKNPVEMPKEGPTPVGGGKAAPATPPPKEQID